MEVPFKSQCILTVKRDAKFLTKYVKGVPFVNRRYTKGVPFLSGNGILKGKEWISRRSPPV